MFDLSCIPFRDLINFARIQRWASVASVAIVVECRAIVLYYNLYFITTEWRGIRCVVGGFMGITGIMGELPGWEMGRGIYYGGLSYGPGTWGWGGSLLFSGQSRVFRLV